MLSMPCASVSLLLFVSFLAPLPASTNQSLEGQLAGLAEDVQNILKTDRVLQGQKVRLDKVSSSGIPDSNYDQFIELSLQKKLADVFDKSAKLILKVEYSYLESDTKTNKGNRVVQLTAKILDRGKPIKLRTREGEVEAETIIREVNNTSDIARILGTTLSPPDSNDYQVRLKATETAHETPKFKLVGGTQVSTPNAQTYSVELRKRAGGKRELKPIKPVNEGGLAFASIDVGDTYAIVLYNYDEKADAVAKLEVDGLDSANTFNTDKAADGKQLSHQGYFVPRAKNGKPGEHLVPGWLHTLKPGNDNIFDFVVNELGKGAAAQLKVRGSTGIVTVRFFDACEENETPRSRSFGETGVGQPRKQDYSVKSAKIGTEPAAIISIRYSRQP